MAWIESHQELRGHPKLELAAEILGIPEVYLAGHLHYLWYWAMDYAQEGDITKYKPVQIARAAGWTGDADEFVTALLECGAEGQYGFLERTTDGRLLIHDWIEYGGRLIQMRKHNADKQRDWRSRQKKSDQAGGADVTTTSRTKPPQQDNVTVTLPSRNGTTVEDITEQDITGHNTTGIVLEEGVDWGGEQLTPPPPPPPAPIPISKVDYPQSMRDRIAFQGMIESAACDLKGRRLTKAETSAINQWAARHKARASPEIVEAAAKETAAHTNGEGLAYFFKVMERMIYHPEQNQPVRKGGNQSGQNGVAAAHESKRASAKKERFHERYGAELDEIRFSGVGDEAPDHQGWPGPGRGLPPGGS